MRARACVLAVDDQPADLALVRLTLEAEGFEVREARSGGEALAVAREVAPDLILLDMHLPDMHGLEVVRRLRESIGGEGLRVAAMSAFATGEDLTQWLEAGCIVTIEKPFQPGVLGREIRRLLAGQAPPAPERAAAGASLGARLGEVLLANTLITPEQFKKALAEQAQSGKRLGQVLVEQGAVNEDDIAWALGNQLGYPYVFLAREIIDEEAVRLLPEEFLRERQILPIFKFGEEMRLAMADPTDQKTVDEVAARTGLQVNRALALASNINELLDHLFSRRDPQPPRTAGTTEAQYLQFHLVQALRQGAAAVHFTPAGEGHGRVRYRLQGVLADRADPPDELHRAIIRRLRDLTGFGESPVGTATATVTVGAVETHLVVTFLPTVVGPAATMALYPLRTGAPDLAALGVDGRVIQALRGALQAASGVVMVGCREPAVRSTLLHALIPSARGGEVWALETVPLIRRPTINQTFVGSLDQVAVHLYAAARTEVDVIVADNIAPSEALKAAQQIARARLVLAGHPEDDVVGLLGQMLEAAGPALVASTLRGILAARAVRALCSKCKETLPEPSGPTGRRRLSARGCEACSFTGFLGQRLLTELWIVDPETRRLLRSSGPGAVFDRVVQTVGSTLRAQGLALVEGGLTSLEELSRAGVD